MMTGARLLTPSQLCSIWTYLDCLADVIACRAVARGWQRATHEPQFRAFAISLFRASWAGLRTLSRDLARARGLPQLAGLPGSVPGPDPGAYEPGALPGALPGAVPGALPGTEPGAEPVHLAPVPPTPSPSGSEGPAEPTNIRVGTLLKFIYSSILQLLLNSRLYSKEGSVKSEIC